MRDDSDESLMVSYRQGDARAFTVLVERHRRPIFWFLLRLVHEPAAAEDLTQDTFLRVINSADSYISESKFTVWLYTIARNACIDARRRGRLRATASLDVPVDPRHGRSETWVNTIPAAEPGIDEQVGRELRERMQAAIDALPDEQREIFLLREVADLQFTEIAEVIGSSESTVKSRMRYALEKLREALADYREMAEVAK